MALSSCLDFMCMPGVFRGRPEKSVRSCGSTVKDSYEPLCGCWEPNSGPLQEQVFVIAEPSLQLLFVF